MVMALRLIIGGAGNEGIECLSGEAEGARNNKVCTKVVSGVSRKVSERIYLINNKQGRLF